MADRVATARQLHRKIHVILMEDWDPIGVRGIPEAKDEYDAYASNVYRLLIHRAPEVELFEYLWWVETKHMGLPGDRQRTQIIARKLRSLVN